jgi:hypothetical protein
LGSAKEMVKVDMHPSCAASIAAKLDSFCGLTSVCKFWRFLNMAALCSICGFSSAGTNDLSISGLAIGQKFDRTQLQTVLQHLECGGDERCWGSLEIGFRALTIVDGKDGKIAKVDVEMDSAQYRFVLRYLTGKYGEPQLLPNKIFGKGPNFVVESGIAEWHGRDSTVMRLSKDDKVLTGTLILFVRSH